MKPTRRHFLAGGATLAATLVGARACAEPVLTEDGLYRQPWFLESFLELADDLQGATNLGKRFAIMWELRGCPYCRETHLVNFARPDIEEYVKTNFEILQLNIVGSRKVTDFDGAEMSEKALAAKYGVRFTPTFQFFPESAARNDRHNHGTVFTGLSGLISSATASLICSMVRILFAPKRGMVEQGSATCEL